MRISQVLAGLSERLAFRLLGFMQGIGLSQLPAGSHYPFERLEAADHAVDRAIGISPPSTCSTS
jgi:hypothetical protein